jgi:thymidylate synthase
LITIIFKNYIYLQKKMRTLKELLSTGEIPTLEESRVYGAVGNKEDAFLIKANDIGDAWFQCVDKVYQNGNIQPVTAGSYEKTGKRKQIFNISGIINYPATRPLEPQIPAGYGIPNPVEPDYLDKYIFKLRYSESKESNEDYVYAEWIEPCYEKILKKFPKDGAGTNQMYIPIGDVKSFDLGDPPCMRGIDIKAVNQKLHFTTYFRSWDLWNGFPANLGGLQLLKEMMIDDLKTEGMELYDGKLMFHSSGLHLYDYAWDLAKTRLNKN